MIDPEVTAWCPRGDHADSRLLRCFGGADGVAFGAAPCFGFAGMSVAWLATKAGARVVTRRTPRLPADD